MCMRVRNEADILFARDNGFPISAPGDVFNYTSPGKCTEGIPLSMLVDTPFTELLLPALWQGTLYFLFAAGGLMLLINGLGLSNSLCRTANERPIMLITGLFMNKFAYMTFYYEFGAVLWRVLGGTIFGFWTSVGYYTSTAFITDFLLRHH